MKWDGERTHVKASWHMVRAAVRGPVRAAWHMVRAAVRGHSEEGRGEGTREGCVVRGLVRGHSEGRVVRGQAAGLRVCLPGGGG